MYDDVLVATDGSDVAATAAEEGLSIAEAFDATLHCVSVVEHNGDEQDDEERSRHQRFVDAIGRTHDDRQG